MQRTAPSSLLSGLVDSCALQAIASQASQISLTEMVTGQRNLAECQFADKILNETLDKVEKGIGKLLKTYPGRTKPVIKSGLRGPKYYIEVPIEGKNVDAFGLILSTEKLLQDAKKSQGAKVTDTDSFVKGEN